MHKKIASTFFIKVIIAFLNLAIVVLLSRFLGAQGKGEASIIITSIAMILLFTNMIGGSSLVFLVPRFPTFLLFIISNVWTVFVCAITFVLFQFLRIIPSHIVLPVITLALINSFLATNLTILLGKEKVMSTNLISLLQTVLNLLVLWVLICYLDEQNIQAYVNSLYAAMGFCLFLSTLLIIPYFKNYSLLESKQTIRMLVKTGFTNQTGHILKFLSFRFSYYVMVYYSGSVTLGVFSNGVALIESLLLISNSFSTILYPRVANSQNQESVRMLTLQMTKAGILLCALALIPLLMLPSSFWIWMFGPEFNGVHEVIVLLSPGILVYNIALITGHYFSGVGRYAVNTISNLLGLLTTIVASLWVIPSYGIMEAGIISSLSYLVTTYYIAYHFGKETNLKMHQLIPRWVDVKWLIRQSQYIWK
jgi:O-antigen/teichoic acid export membrane protein